MGRPKKTWKRGRLIVEPGQIPDSNHYYELSTTGRILMARKPKTAYLFDTLFKMELRFPQGQEYITMYIDPSLVNPEDIEETLVVFAKALAKEYNRRYNDMQELKEKAWREASQQKNRMLR